MLSDYTGTLLLVSHDRDFLDRTVTSILAPTGDGHWTEYAGGYSDMLAQRQGQDLELRKAERSEASAVPRKAATESVKAALTPRTKLSFKDTHALAELPGEIAKLESEIKTLSAKLADPELYARDRAAFDKTSARISDAQRQLDDAETRWLELEEKRAAIENSER
jgi:ATP-binding cassette subfamily F protein uup